MSRLIEVGDTVEVTADSRRGFNGTVGQVIAVDWPWVMVSAHVDGVLRPIRFAVGELSLVDRFE